MIKLLGLVTLTFSIFFPTDIFALEKNIDEDIPKILKTFIKEYHIPGVVLSIKFPNYPVKTFAAGYANLTSKKPMTEETYFPIGSITKSVTSAVILKLQEEGKLKITDTLRDVASDNSKLKELIDKYPKLQSITIQQLLNHTSGLPEVLTSSGYKKTFTDNPELHWKDVKLLELAMQEKFGKPGKTNYTNTDYILAGLIIESITAKPLAYSVQTILHQADISDAYFPTTIDSEPSKSIMNELAHGYMPENPYWPAQIMKILRSYPKAVVDESEEKLVYDVTSIDLAQLSVAPAAGGVVMRVPDLISWYESLFFKKKIIDSESLKQMLNTVKINKHSGYGLGVMVDELPVFHAVIYHTGSNFGYNTNLIFIQNSNFIIAVAINTQRDTLNFNEGLVKVILSYLSNYSELK